jgi:hypothetical protein
MSALEDRWSPRAGKTAGDQRVLCTGPQHALCEVRHFMIRRSDLRRYRHVVRVAFRFSAGLDEVRHEVRYRSRGAALARRLASVLSCRCGRSAAAAALLAVKCGTTADGGAPARPSWDASLQQRRRR